MEESLQKKQLRMLNELIEANKKRLHRLRVRVALEGRDVRPADENEIDTITEEIEVLERQREVLNSGGQLDADAEDLETLRGEIVEREKKDVRIQAAFTNRMVELDEKILGPSSKSFVYVTGPAGYGKTYLIDEIRRRLAGDDQIEWHVVYYKCQKTDQDQVILTDLARVMGYAGVTIREMNGFLQLVKKVFEGNEKHKPKGLFLVFDEVEKWKSDNARVNEWEKVAGWVQQELVPNLDDILAREGVRFRAIFAGRYISGLADDFPLPSKLLSDSVSLSSFDLEIVEIFVRDTLSRFFGRGETYGNEYVRGLAANVLEITGGHPGAIADLLQYIGETEGFNVSLRTYFCDNHRQELFEKFVADKIEGLLKDVPDSLKSVLEFLCVFRGFNNTTLDTVLRQGLVSWVNQDGWALLRHIAATHLIVKKPGPLYCDRILQRILNARNKFLFPDRYRELHRFAASLYLHWVRGQDVDGKPLDTPPSGTDQIVYAVEYLYHSCCSDQVSKQIVLEEVDRLLVQIRHSSGPRAGREGIFEAIKGDRQLSGVLESLLGEGYPSFLEHVKGF